MKFVLLLAFFLAFACQVLATADEPDRNSFAMNFPYGRELENDLQTARLLTTLSRLYHPKRNSEIINALLGLPKEMLKAGK